MDKIIRGICLEIAILEEKRNKIKEKEKKLQEKRAPIDNRLYFLEEAKFKALSIKHILEEKK